MIDASSVRPIVDYHTVEVFPVYRVFTPPNPGVRGFPYRRSQIVDIAERLWKDARDWWVLVQITKTITEYDSSACAPSALLTKKLQGGTFQTEMRLISDVRLPSNFCDKDDYLVRVNPTLAEIATRVEFLDRFPPVFLDGLPREMPTALLRGYLNALNASQPCVLNFLELS